MRSLPYWRENVGVHYRRIGGKRYSTRGRFDNFESKSSRRFKEALADYKEHYKSVRVLKFTDGSYQIYTWGLKPE